MAKILPESIIPYLHKSESCEYDKAGGEGCVIHDPSDHHRREWDIIIRTDSGLAERRCRHAVGHPDPDSLRWFVQTGRLGMAGYLGVHGCDGCCRPVGPLPKLDGWSYQN